MRIFGQSEYGMVVVTFFISIVLRGLVDVYMYDMKPYSRDVVLELWQGNFIFDKYWQFICGFFSFWGYVWGHMCSAHVKVIYDRGEMEKGTICRRLLGF
jgi:hypothetical protein